MKNLLEVIHLTKVFTLGSLFSRIRVRAVDDVSFHIQPAEIFTLAGESGCGKTTIARMILGFEEPTSGKILYQGKEHKKSDKVWLTQGIQAVFQDPFGTFNPLRTVDQYFFETIRNYRLASTREEAVRLIDEKLRVVGLSFEEFAGKYPNEFSGGQLQRISIARALLTDPRLLIADEPVSMVDASLRMSIVNLFKDLKERMGVSVLYITHDLATAYYVGDRIAVMFRGNIVEMGPVEKVLMEPRHPYTQLLRDSIPEADPRKRWTSRLSLLETEYQEYLRVGCKFAGRCPYVMEICRERMPEFVEVEGVLVRCYKYDGSQGE
ncbi:MAG: ABC transporter ATP-binding protein [Anaerolineae bacterium]|nr:ABC transporter ATP-binding protein [Anaerolineae bacterium]MCX8067701.1 ABC transporter ATP-binding protein [Anaerolineae bacterium]MDW7992772.1 ABC transporter ATP-binding protein [Anaerolineae bacterium]MDW8069157.1 ABC transporter ATP-binding protein [Anaerolineae bacterium]